MAELYRQNRTFFNVEDDTWTALAIWSILSSTGIIGSLNKVIGFLLERETVWDTAINTPVFIVFILLGTAAAIKKMQRREFILILAIIILWVFSFFINEHSRALMQAYYFRSVLIEGVCGIICISSFKNWEKFKNVGSIVVAVGALLYFTTVILQILGKTEIQYMAAAYNSLIFIIGAYWLAIHKKSVLFWLIAIVGTLAILIAGNRGGLLCIAVYVVLEFMLNKKNKILPKLLFFLLIAILYFNIDTVMYNIENLISKYDYESRTIEMFFEGTFNDGSGREEYRAAAWEFAKERPILGYGMAGSSYHLYEKVKGVTPVGIQHTYSHSLFFDILMDYGIIMGGIILLILLIGLFRAFSKSRKNNNSEILFLFFSIVIPKLMLSSVYLGESAFFILLGLILNFNCLKYEKEA